jgi:hypothetical protein
MADAHADKRANILAESISTRHETKWGYFGYTGPLAIGDDSLAPRLQRQAPAEDAGDPIRNICTGPMKKGAGPEVYFSFSDPLCIGDPYVDPMLRTKKPKVQMIDPEASFKPPGKVKYSVNRTGYDYQPHCDTVKDPLETHAKYKDVLPVRNCYTNPAKKGGAGVLVPGVLFGMNEERKFQEYMPDDYDIARKLRLEELAAHRAKLQEQPFKSTEFGMKVFQKDDELYHNSEPGSQIPRDPVPQSTNAFPHEMPFKTSNPSKKGRNSTMGAFPEHMEDPVPSMQPKQRKLKVEGEEPPPAWRPCVPAKQSNPMGSVVSMTRNLRSERPTSFMRPCLSAR